MHSPPFLILRSPPLLHMPTLGFLKKKRTKESKEPHHPASPTSESATTNPTTTTTTSSSTNARRESVTSASSTSSNHVLSAAPSADSAKPDGPMSLVDQSTSTNEVHNHQQQQPPQPPAAAQQQYASTPTQPPLHAPTQPYPPNAAHINNLINPPQPEGIPKDHSAIDARHNGVPTGATATPNAEGQPSRPTSKVTKGKYQLGDFTIQRTLGTGSFGRVHLVQSRHNLRFYAVKVLKKQQVVKMKQVEHTNDERRMLGLVKHPFLITLWGTFQDSRNLYMVMDFVEGGELFSLLRKSQVRHAENGRAFTVGEWELPA